MSVNGDEEQELFTPLSHYKQVEEYFYRKDQELIRKLREKADAERKRKETEHRKAMHWMKCPKCGSSMQEVELYHIKVDRCTECHGIYLDKEELEILIKMQKKEDFLTRLTRRWAEKLARSKIYPI